MAGTAVDIRASQIVPYRQCLTVESGNGVKSANCSRVEGSYFFQALFQAGFFQYFFKPV